MSSSITLLQSQSVLGKRTRGASLILHLSSSPEPSYNPSDTDFDNGGPSVKPCPTPLLLVNGALMADTKKRYQCTHTGCGKSYSKPSRLEEHQRSHTGQRPFVCETCNKSFLRDTHLHAHSRKHLPESSRPLECPQDNCEKRFWTQQHLRVHMNWHEGAKTFRCSEDDCNEAFAKHHHLRAHMCSAHAPPGTKPYPCTHEGCTRSFNTNQHLRTHSKVHDEQRYTCVHGACLSHPGGSPTYYPTWTALQHHLRTAHPPTCTHSSCNGRIFTSQKGLRAHQKLHEQRELEEEMAGSNADDLLPPQKRRRGGEIGRDWKCNIDNCHKDFKSKKALETHTKVTHLGRRDHVCMYDGCHQTYGYKHLLQRHLAKTHNTASIEHDPLHDRDDSDDSNSASGAKPSFKGTSTSLDIDTITGFSYAQRTRANVANATALLCPYPQLATITLAEDDVPVPIGTNIQCDYSFSRVYDFRRHLKSAHGVNAVKESIEQWVSRHKNTPRPTLQPTPYSPPSAATPST